MPLQCRCCTLRSEALHIPLDVAESIIDSLRYDHNALQACALTCRSWVHRSRTHLHRTFVIKHTGVALFSDSEVRRHILLRDLPCILEYADEVTLESVSGAENRDIGRCCFQFWDTVRRLRHIRKLTILGTELCGSSISLGGSCWDTLFPAVESLSLRGATVASARDILRLASSFRGLRTLDFDTVGQLASAGVESKARFASSPDSITMHLHPSDSFSTLNLAPQSIRFEHCHDKFIADILLSHLESAQHAQIALQTLQLHTTLSVDESAPLEASMRAAVSLRDLHIVVQEQAEIPEFRSNLISETLQRASQWIEVCERLEVLRLSLRRQQLLAMISMVSPCHVKPYSLNTVWDVYGEILRGLSRASFRELVLHVDASDIEQAGLHRLENSLSQHSALRTVKSVRFLVGGYFTSRERLHQSMERWSGNLRRLRTTHAVHIDFYRKLCFFSN